MKKEQMWDNFLKTNSKANKYDAWSFGGNTPQISNMLANLVLVGQKTATSSAYPCYEAENSPLPQIGSYNIILDSNEEAICIIKTTKVYTIPFDEVSAEHAFKEGEGDKSLQFWRNCHKEFFSKELETMGLTFTEKMLVVCEEFMLVYKAT